MIWLIGGQRVEINQMIGGKEIDLRRVYTQRHRTLYGYGAFD